MKRNFKKIFLLMAIVVTAMVCFAISASAASLASTGKCGNNVTWSYNSSTGKLVLSGSGDTYNYDFDDSPFYHTNITDVVINSGITGIGDYLFWYCDYLKTVKIPNTVTFIGSSAFFGCKNLQSVTIPDSVLFVKSSAFNSCSAMKSVTIGNGTVQIESRAFSGCTSLATVKIGNNVKNIGTGVFSGCYSLSNIVIPASVKTIDSYAFEECYSLKNVYFTGTKAQWSAITKSARGNECLTSATIHYNYKNSSSSESSGSSDSSTVNTNGKTSKITATQSTNAIKLTWAKVSGAAGYKVYQKSGSTWKTLGTVTGTSGTIKNLKVGTKYSFAVKAAYKVNSKVVWSSAYTTIDTATKTVAPSKVNSTYTSSSIKLSWTSCAGATGYRIYFKSGGEWKVALSTTSSTSYTFTGLKAGAKYTFAVRPYIKHGSNVIWSDYTQCIASTTPATPSVQASTTATSITLSWNKVNADGYRIYYKSGSSGWKTAVNTTSKTTQTFNNLPTGKTYIFAVKAYRQTSAGVIWSGYKQLSVTVKQVTGVPETKAEIADAYNRAVNGFKDYKGGAFASTVMDLQVRPDELSLNPDYFELLEVCEEMSQHESFSRTYENGVETDYDYPIGDDMLPSPGRASLRAAGIKSASVTENLDGGYTMTINLVEEKTSYRDGVYTKKAIYHNDVICPLVEFCSIYDDGIRNNGSTDTYSATVITATVDAKGRLTNLEIKLPMTTFYDLSNGYEDYLFMINSKFTVTYDITYF